MGNEDRDYWNERVDRLRSKEREPESTFSYTLDSGIHAGALRVELCGASTPRLASTRRGITVLEKRRRRSRLIAWCVAWAVLAVVSSIVYYFARS